MDPQDNFSLCHKCNELIRKQNYPIHAHRCKGPSPSKLSSRSSMSNRTHGISRHSQLHSNRSQQWQEMQEKIPCLSCGYRQTLAELDTHPTQCQHRQQDCEYCHNKFPRSLMQQHLQVCSQHRQIVSQSRSRNFMHEDYDEDEEEDFIPRRVIHYQPYEDYQMSPRRRGNRQGMFSRLQEFIQFLAGQTMIGERPEIGLTKQAIKQFPITKYARSKNNNPDEEEKCIICYCNLEQEDDVMTLPCMHAFHPECVGTWLQKNPTCPLCKHNFGAPRKQESEEDPRQRNIAYFSMNGQNIMFGRFLP